jgi:hypothetical protein
LPALQVQPQQSTPAANTAQIKDEFVKKARKQGLIEKFYNFLKNKTGVGLGSNKVKEAIGAQKEDLDKIISNKNINARYKTYKLYEKRQHQRHNRVCTGRRCSACGYDKRKSSGMYQQRIEDNIL